MDLFVMAALPGLLLESTPLSTAIQSTTFAATSWAGSYPLGRSDQTFASLDQLLALGSLVVAKVAVALYLVLQAQYFCQEPVPCFLGRGGSSPTSLSLPKLRRVDVGSFAASANDYYFWSVCSPQSKGSLQSHTDPSTYTSLHHPLLLLFLESTSWSILSTARIKCPVFNHHIDSRYLLYHFNPVAVENAFFLYRHFFLLLKLNCEKCFTTSLLHFRYWSSSTWKQCAPVAVFTGCKARRWLQELQ